MRALVGFVLAAVGVLAGLLVPVAASTASAAATVDGFAIDGAADDPLSDGLQQLYEPPTTTLTQVANTNYRTTITLRSSTDGWQFRFKAPTGEQLAVGTYQAFPDPTTVYAGLLVERTGHACEFWAASFTIHELSWAQDDSLVSLSADFQHACYPHQPLYGSIRYNATTPIRAIATDTFAIDLGQTEAGTPGAAAGVTVTNIGHGPVSLGHAAVDQVNDDVAIASDACDDAPLAAGASCVVEARLTGAHIGLGRFASIAIPDDTPRGARTIRAGGDVWTDTSITLRFDPTRTSWPNGTFIGATVVPPPAFGGTVTFRYQDPGGDPVALTAPVADDGEAGVLADVPRGDHTWTATFSGDNAWRPSTSSPVAHHTGLVTITTLTALVNPVSAGDTVHLVAESSGAADQALPAGTLTIRSSGGTVVGSGPVGAGGDAVTADVSGLALGSHDFTATYATTEDGAPSSAPYRVFVKTQGIEEAWTGSVPMTTGVFQIYAVATDGSGVYVAGETGGTAQGESPAGGQDVVVARLDAATGAVTWVTQLGTAFDERARDIVVTSQGVFVSGESQGSIEPGGPTVELRPFLARLTTSGDVAWIRQGPRPGDAWMVAAAPDGGAYVASTARLSTDLTRDAGQVRRYAPDGSLRWEREITSCCTSGKAGGLSLWTLASDPGGLLVGGRSVGSTVGANHADERGWVRRLTPLGATAWTRELDGPYGAVWTTDAAASQAGILATGTSQAPIAGQPNAFPDENVWMRRYSFGGATAWTKPIVRNQLVPDCGAFAALSGTQSVPWGSPGGTVARLGMDGVDQWRFERPGTPTVFTVFNDLALAPGRAFIVEQTGWYTGTTDRILALTGIPRATDCDTELPVAGSARASFVAGSILGSAAAVKVAWTASDGQSGVARHELRRATDGGAWTVASDGLTAPELVLQLATGHDYRFASRAVDRAGNGASGVGPWMSLRRFDDRSATIRYGGRWTSTTSSTASGGTLRRATAAGATASLTFTGRAIAWVAPRGATRGSARVYVDGTAVATISLWRSSSDAQRVVWTRSWTSAGRHTVTIRVLGTSGHPRVDVDAFLVLD